MKSAVENLGPTRVKLTVEVPFDELRPNLDAAYKRIGAQVQLPGFRRGKVPNALIDKRFGRAVVLDEAVNEALPRLYAQALQDNEVDPLGQPDVDVTEFNDGEQLIFTAEVDAKPDLELPDYSAERVEVESAAVSDDEVAEQLTTLAQRFGSLTDVDRAAAEGDFVTIDLTAAQDGEQITDARADSLSYRIGSEQGLPGLDEAVTGKKAGETAEFTSTLAAGEHAGEEADVTVSVIAVREQELPELDDDFAQLASEFDTIDELRAALRDQLERQKRLTQAADARDAVLERLLELVDVPVPESAVADEVAARRESIDSQLEQVGMGIDDYLTSEGQSAEEYEADLDKRSRDALRSQFILDEIATAESIEVSQEELTEHLIRRAQQSQMTPQDFAEQAMQNNYVPVLVREVVRGKALAHAVETFTVADVDGNEVTFDHLDPDGSVHTHDEPEDENVFETSDLPEGFDPITDSLPTDEVVDPAAQDATTGDEAGAKA